MGMAVWLHLDDATDLFSSSMDSSTVSWDLSSAKTEDVLWQDAQCIVPKDAQGAARALADAESSWRHELAFIPRCFGGNTRRADDLPTHCFCVHKLTLLADSTNLNKDLVAQALEWEAESTEGRRVALDSSNVNGFHSGRSVENWRDGKLLSSLKEAIADVQRVERELQKLSSQCETSLRADDTTQDELSDISEIWLNVSRSGAWNMLHTHPGCRWSGSYYVSDGGALGHGGGQLMLLPTAPPQLAEHHHVHMVSLAVAHMASSSLSDTRDHNELYFLQVPPTPGSMIVFPSFVPHFVLPCHVENSEKVGSGDVGRCVKNQTLPRISVAFNVG